MQQLRDQVDDGKIDTNRLEKLKNKQVKISADHYMEKFQKHVERGAFITKIEVGVGEEMRQYR